MMAATAGPPLLAWPGREEALADELAAAIARLVSAQLDVVLHHPAFQRLEAGWRGLAWLAEEVARSAREAETDDGDAPARVVLRVLDVAWPEICADLLDAVDLERSVLFELVYVDAFDTPGGHPYGVLLCDHALGHEPAADHPMEDMAVLAAMVRVAAAAFSPFVAGVAPRFFQLESFRDLPPDIRPLLAGQAHAAWDALRDLEDARFGALALPRVLMRLPWMQDSIRADGFRYDEDVSAPDGGGWLWGSPVYALGAVLARAFHRHGWFGRIHGIERDAVSAGVVAGLPFAQFDTDRPVPGDGRRLSDYAHAEPAAPRIVTEIALGEEQSGQLSAGGFLPLSAVPRLPFAAFLGAQTIQRPRRSNRAEPDASAQLSARLGHMLCVARFAHCIKAIGRDQLGGPATLERHQQTLHDWLQQWCSDSEGMSEDLRARYPLRRARATLAEVPGKPGAYECAIHLVPHFQFEDAQLTISLATELRPVAAGTGS
jgi:type VI secretion system ImpC/EvpB family protein